MLFIAVKQGGSELWEKIEISIMSQISYFARANQGERYNLQSECGTFFRLRNRERNSILNNMNQRELISAAVKGKIGAREEVA